MTIRKTLAAAMALTAMTLDCGAQTSPEEKLNMTMYAIMNHYVDSVDKARFVDYHIASMMRSLDPFSEYLPPATARQDESVLAAAPQQEPAPTAKKADDERPRTVNSAYMAGKTVGYIALTMFGPQTAEEVREALARLRKQGMKSLIIDLQQNGGGLVDQAVEVADEFLPKGLTVFTAKGRNIPAEEFKTQRDGTFEKGRLTVLTGAGTKSAAELFAAALHDNGRATVVGTRTFGKGLIQETLPFADGSALRITVARYFTPKGVCIQKPYTSDGGDQWGVKPDVEVEPDTLHRTSFWYNLITVSGVQTLVARTFANEQGQRLKREYDTAEKFIRNYESLSLFDNVLAKATELGYECSADDLQKCKAYVCQQLKALVGRHLYGNDCFTQVMNERNRALVRALEMSDDGKH